MVKKLKLALLVVLISAFGTQALAQSGVTKTVTGLTPYTSPAVNDVVMVVDVSDTSMAASGTNKKLEIQYIPRGFPVGSLSGVSLQYNTALPGSISGASLSPAIFGPGVISGASLSPSVFGPQVISGASLNPSIFGSQAITGASLAYNVRYDSLQFNFDKLSTGVTLASGISVFMICQANAVLKGVDVVTYHPGSANGGVTIQFYKANKAFPGISAAFTVFSGNGVSTFSSGATCFDSWSSGGTTFSTNDVIVGVVGVSSTVPRATATLKLLRD